MKKNLPSIAVAAFLFFSNALSSQVLTFNDPVGDDTGPGSYSYPTDPIYTSGSFDLKSCTLTKRGSELEIAVGMNAKLQDVWNTGAGFSLQMIVIFVDTDGKEGSGFTDGLPGMNIKFDAKSVWEKAIIICPVSSSQLNSEIAEKASSMQNSVIVPSRVTGAGLTISTRINLSDLTSDGDFTKFGYQICVMSYNDSPDNNSLLIRKVNEYEGTDVFGGGNDSENCAPNILDIIAGSAVGNASEINEQLNMLNYTCNEDGPGRKMATLSVLRKN